MPSAPTFSRRDLLAASLAAAAASLSGRLARAGEAPAAFQQAVPFAVTPIPLESVRLTGGPLKHAQDLGQQNILTLDPDRILFHFRLLAGLEPKASADYGSWEGPGRQLTGHIAGHYLSACSLMFAATGNPEFKKRADYVVDELATVQDKRGNGYVGALMGNPPGPQRARGAASQPASRPAAIDGLLCFQQLSTGDIRASGFDLNGMWSPWYVQHKILAGLRDAYRRTHNPKALDVALKFAAWTDALLAPLSDEQLQQMLSCEFGGINESFADLYADTGDKRWLALSRKFHHNAIVNPLAAKHDILAGQHGNTNVPKLLGELVRYVNAGNAPDGDAAKFFWNAVAYHHSFATGGHGYDEFFDAPDKLSDEVDGNNHAKKDLRTNESCNVYNMVKLTRLLFALTPDEQFAAFHERALFNHVLASINFDDGQVCYMVPVSPGVTHEYQGNAMTCCVGTGLENHALHGEGLYYHSPTDLYVNLFAPSTARSDALHLDLTMDTNFPEQESATLTLKPDQPREFTLHLRRPAWASGAYTVSLNGQPLDSLPKPGDYLLLKRQWSAGDTLTFTLPRALRVEPLPDNPARVAFLQGPLVLAADLGDAPRGRRNAPAGPAQFPTLAAKPGAAASDILKPAEKPNTFTAPTTAANPLTFAPFYTLSNRRYGIYWDLTAPA